MPTEKKVATVQELRERIERSTIVIAAEYRGLSVTDIAALRKAVRDAGVEMRVVKNRLFLRAANDAHQPGMAELLAGPTAVLFGYEDVAASAKAVTEYQRQARNAFAVRNGMMDGQLLSVAQIQELASLLPRPVLLSQLAGLLQAPVTRLASLLNASVQDLAGLLDSRARQLDEAQPAPATAAAAEPEPAAELAPTAEAEPAAEPEPAAEAQSAPEAEVGPAAEAEPAAE
jgi:large subunit ribosomal protein L10